MPCLSLPRAVAPLAESLRPAFTAPTYRRFVLWSVGAIVAGGRRTVSRILWAVRSLAWGHPSSCHRVFSAARWSPWPLGRVLASAVLDLVPADEPVVLAADDTVDGHAGKRVYARGCHRDAVRSGWGITVWKWGHRWVVLAVLVKFPFASRRWALPVLWALYRPRELNEAEGRRHKVPSELARQLVAALMHWFPQRRFILLGDGHFSSHRTADFARGHKGRLTVVGRLRKDAGLYAKPPPRRKRRGSAGRPRVIGRKLRCPAEQVAHARRRHLDVRWYGQGKRRVGVVSGTGVWYRHGLRAEVRWVYVHDPVGRRTDYLYSTDPRMSPRRVIELYAGRWSIEVTFQEARAHLGWETTRHRCRRSVLRVAPCLMGLFTAVTLVFHCLGRSDPQAARPAQTACYPKAEATFSDALAAVRRALWSETILGQPPARAVVAKCPHRLRTLLLDYLAHAA